ncbi:MAG TPA: tetratricopeptide repeat protein [Rubricoccaceae bacterium]|nr:tetratricopeptide repeat protein [Rubricoccaceae bacterium]
MRSLLLLVVLAAPLQAQTLGETDFPNSGAPEAQAPFLRGLLLLHSFEYDEARDAFREAQRLDPDFAMAYWGEAMTHNHPIWMEQDRAAALEVLARLAPTPEAQLASAPTEREKDYLRALHVLYGDGDKEGRDDAYAEATAALAARYPDDLDAAAFHALAILGTAHEGRDFSTYMRAAAVAEAVFDRNPRHPGAAHYLIHAYDDPVHAPLGLRPARAYAEIAPDASHALHMPSHIYVALGMWDEAAEMNRRSFEAARAATERRAEPLNGHGWHALYWLNYVELQRGRYAEARGLLDRAAGFVEAAASPRAKVNFLAMLASYLVETEDWDLDVGRYEVTHEGLGSGTATRMLYTSGQAALAQGEVAVAEAALEALLTRIADNPEPGETATALALEALILQAKGETEAALAKVAEAATVEDAMPLDFGPPFPVKPVHELWGEMLLDLGRAEEAQVQFERALERAPRRARSLLGLARSAEVAGDMEKAFEVWAELDAVWFRADADVRDVVVERPVIWDDR